MRDRLRSDQGRTVSDDKKPEDVLAAVVVKGIVFYIMIAAII